MKINFVDRIDIAIALGKGSKWQDNEIKYCLRSLEQNFINIGRVFIIGFKPDWIQNIIHLEVEDSFRRNKDANLIKKYLEVCKTDISENFLKISDDQVLLNKTYWGELFAYHNGELKIDQFKNMNRWRKRVKNTFETLSNSKNNVYNYETHIPFIYNKKGFSEIINRYDWSNEEKGFTINTLYYNNLDIIRDNIGSKKLTIERPYSYNDIKEKLKNKIYLGYNEKGLNDHLKIVLEELFPNKSKYEK